jgi:hypothetical protein
MKGKISILGLTLVLILGLGLAPALAATSTPVFLGETTWTADITTSSQGHTGSATVTGAITRLGPNYYLFQGYVDVSVTGDTPFVLGGSGRIIGDQLIMNLTTSEDHTQGAQTSPWQDTGVMRVSLNTTHTSSPDTYLCGSLYEVGHDYDTGGKVYGGHYSAGTLTLSGTPIPLTTASPAATSLLLMQ